MRRLVFVCSGCRRSRSRVLVGRRRRDDRLDRHLRRDPFQRGRNRGHPTLVASRPTPGRPRARTARTSRGATFTIEISSSTFSPHCFTASASQAIQILNEDDIDPTFAIPETRIDVSVEAGETFNGEPIASAV
jgi:hypothetical protein